MSRSLRFLILAAGLLCAPTFASAADDSEARIRARIAAAWLDATTTWARILGARVYESDLPQINFVGEVRASHCYGLYVNAGPVYCTGNNTVFVSLGELERITERFKSVGDDGLAFLVAHELGHHIQKVTGRFRVLSAIMRASPQLQRELALRFELEADCLAGVWAANSDGFAKSAEVRNGITAALDAIGDDKMRPSAGVPTTAQTLTHGTSAQRRRWFETGLAGGNPATCNVLEALEY